MWQFNLSTSIHNVLTTTLAEFFVEVGTTHLREHYLIVHIM